MSESQTILPMIPLRGMVVYPKVTAQLDIGRDKSIKAVEKAMADDRLIAVVAQLDENVEDPVQSEIATVGTLAKIKQMLRLPGGIIRILVEGIHRITIDNIELVDGYNSATFTELKPIGENMVELEAYRRFAQSKFLQWTDETKSVSEEVVTRIMNINNPNILADQIASVLPVPLFKKQQLLDILDIKERLHKIIAVLNTELEISHLEEEINHQVRQQMEMQQKEYFLREKIRAIHDELGDKVDPDEEANELREQLSKLKVSDDIRERIEKEIARYSRMPQMMPESTILRNYLDWVLALPWDKESEDRLDINEAAKILNQDHYGLEKIKERILEFLAVRKLSGSQGGSILCLVGPPGLVKHRWQRLLQKQ